VTRLEDFSPEQWFSSIHCRKAAYISSTLDSRAYREFKKLHYYRDPYATNRLVALRHFLRTLRQRNIEVKQRLKISEKRYLLVDAIGNLDGKSIYYIFAGTHKLSYNQLYNLILREAHKLARLAQVPVNPDEIVLVRYSDPKVKSTFHFCEENITERVKNLVANIVPGYQRKIRLFLETRLEVPNVRMGEHCREDSPSNACPYIPTCKNLSKQNRIQNFKNLRFQTKQILRRYNVKKRAAIPSTYGLTEKETLIIRDMPYQKEQELKYFLNETIGDHPLAFLDFEAFTYAFPILPNVRGDKYTTFQYSVHLLKDWKAEPIHREFLALDSDQPTVAFTKSIIRLLEELIEDEYRIIVYNQTFELERLREIPYFQVGKGKLMLSRLEGTDSDGEDDDTGLVVDLYVPFRKQWYYSPIQQGSMGLKAVYKSFTADQNNAVQYDDLAIRNGLEAAEAYQLAQIIRQRGGAKSKRFLRIKENLLEYCKLDTWAMYVIIKELRSRLLSNDSKR